MPLNRRVSRVFYRRLYAGISQTVTLYKRGDGQQSGQVTPYKLFRCVRLGDVQKSGESLEHDITASMTTTWLIPNVELKRVGVLWINALDMLVDAYNRWWQPEAGTLIEIKQFEEYTRMSCLRVDPYPNTVKRFAGVSIIPTGEAPAGG